MKKEIAIRLFSVLFLGVFIMKMLISIAPLIIAHFDRQAVNAVIMQLEIENNEKTKDWKETSVKEYLTVSCYGFTILHPAQIILTSLISADHDKHVQAFYPPVSTPPPNA